MKFILALDQGTTSSRAILFDDEARPRGVAQREFSQIFPAPGRVEHDAREIWESQVGVLREVLETTGIAASEIAAVGITNQRETVVVWDRRTGEPIGNAIVWQDRRTAEICERLAAEGHLPLVRERTGLLLDPYFSATKIAWILDSVPGARARAEAGELACGTIDSWLVWKLTEGAAHVTESSNASRTSLCDIRSGCWDDELLELFRVPRGLLPEIRSSSEVYGSTRGPDCPLQVPIAGIAGDQHAALFGQGCWERGAAKNTYGTGCFVLVNTGSEPCPSASGLLTTVAWNRDGNIDYALEGSVFIAGAAIQWLRDGLGIIDSAEAVEALASTVTDSGGVAFVPAFAGLGAPHWDPFARGMICGLTRGTTTAHLARAALEGIAHQVADVVAAMESDSTFGIEELRVDGGAARNDLLMQIQADLLGIPIVRPRLLETTALGAAHLAALAVGQWRDEPLLAPMEATERRFEPRISRDEAASERARWARALDRTRERGE